MLQRTRHWHIDLKVRLAPNDDWVSDTAPAFRLMPQTIARHGHARAVLLSIEDYRTLTGTGPDFQAWLLGGPKVHDFPLERSRDTGREIDL